MDADAREASVLGLNNLRESYVMSDVVFIYVAGRHGGNQKCIYELRAGLALLFVFSSFFLSFCMFYVWNSRNLHALRVL